MIGKIRLMLVLEVLSIIIAIVYSFKSFTLLMILRVLSGMVGGLSIGLIPVVCVDMFPAKKAGLGSCLSYVFIVTPILIAGLQDPIHGGKQGLFDNWQFIFWVPAIFGGLRLILLIAFLGLNETPQFWIDTFHGEDKDLEIKLNKAHEIVYKKEDADKLSKVKIEARNIALANNEKGVGFKDMFNKKYRKRFLIGCLINTF